MKDLRIKIGPNDIYKNSSISKSGLSGQYLSDSSNNSEKYNENFKFKLENLKIKKIKKEKQG